MFALPSILCGRGVHNGRECTGAHEAPCAFWALCGPWAPGGLAGGWMDLSTPTDRRTELLLRILSVVWFSLR